ncbi:DUF4097 family beta strand repeat-containing protein [Kribbella solani]|uniref:DUF4097 domain-containing protein n=2 Tax=Kribbella solani TaxID=236067 RepID=A0A841DVR0_9ACTN|nr:DUF4097 family beta strand repeat-containing protein [Kribbella solani]MBB5982199.1 hypothetical protein [Kribbella solani]
MAENKQLGVVLLVVAAGLGFWQFGDRDSSDTKTVNDKITSVRLTGGHSDVSIKVSDDDKTTVHEKRTYWFRKHGDAYSVQDGVLVLKGDCGWQCSADFELTVPRGTKVVGQNGSGDLKLIGVGGVDAKSRSGNVELRDVQGDVNLDVTSGDVSATNVAGKFAVKASSGEISGRELKGGAVDVETTSGDIELQLTEANDVQVRGTSSDIGITVPSSDYKVSTDTRHGDVENQLGSTPNGSHSISATTTSGDIELRTN